MFVAVSSRAGRYSIDAASVVSWPGSFSQLPHSKQPGKHGKWPLLPRGRCAAGIYLTKTKLCTFNLLFCVPGTLLFSLAVELVSLGSGRFFF